MWYAVVCIVVNACSGYRGNEQGENKMQLPEYSLRKKKVIKGCFDVEYSIVVLESLTAVVIDSRHPKC